VTEGINEGRGWEHHLLRQNISVIKIQNFMTQFMEQMMSVDIVGLQKHVRT